MKNLPYRILVIIVLASFTMAAQQFKTPVQEYKVSNGTVVSIEASYAEIEIQEWNKNKVEIQGVMTIQGLSEKEAQGMFDHWDINAQAEDNTINIRSSSSNFGNEYFFIHNDKYLGNVVVDVPEISTRVMDIIDSVHFELPELEDFPDIDFNFDFQFDYDSIAFDYEEFKENSEYLKEWQERNKEQLERLKEEIMISRDELVDEQHELHEQIIVIREQAREEAEAHAKEARAVAMERQEEAIEAAMEHAHRVREKERLHAKEAREVQRTTKVHAVEAEKARQREYEVKRIIDNRQKVKIKKTLRIKVPKSAKLEMNVDYCKITTIK